MGEEVAAGRTERSTDCQRVSADRRSVLRDHARRTGDSRTPAWRWHLPLNSSMRADVIRIIARSVMGLILVVGLLRGVYAADARDVCEPRVFEGGEGKKLNYRLLKPLHYVATERYPLVLFLHGGGEKGDDNVSQLIHGMNDFSSDVNREKYPAFVVAPQCPKGASWAKIKDARLVPNAEPTEPMQLVLELLDALSKEFSIDADRVYVTGASMGGYGAWYLGGRFPERFAAIAPVCGGGDELQAEKLARLPIWAFHGAADTGNDPAMSREMIAAIRRAGGNPLYTEYPGVEHNSWGITYSNPLFMTWLFGQRRGR